MSELTTEKLKEYLVQVGDRLNPSRLGHRVRFIKSLFKWTHEEGYIPKNLAAKLKEPKLGKRIPKFLCELELRHRYAIHMINNGELLEVIQSLLRS